MYVVHVECVRKNNVSTWICSQCAEELGELNGWCEYCKHERGIMVYNPDKYFIRDIRISYITYEQKPQKMTPQEELFSKLFNHEKVLVRDMDMLTLRAHREELSKIAFEAKARLIAVDDEEKVRKNKSADGKPTGFQRSVNTDETTTAAINTIKERQKKLTKSEKIQAGLEKLGISSADASKLMQAGTILAQIKDKKSKDIMLGNETRSPLTQQNGFVIQKSAEELNPAKAKIIESKSIFNPFEKKI